MDRGAMYGSVRRKWKGPYPNPGTAQEREDLEYAMIRRKSEGSQNVANWKHYNFYGVFNGNADTYSPQSSNADLIRKIYASKAEKETLKKFGASGEDVLKTTGLSSEIKLEAQDANSKFIPEMMRDNSIADLMSRKASNETAKAPVNSLMQEIMSLRETDEQTAISKLNTVGKSLKRYGDSLQDLIDIGSDIDASVGEMVVKHQESRIGDAIRLDQKSYTSALNILEQIDNLKRITDQIEEDSSKLPNFGLTGNKINFKDRGVTKQKNEMELMKWSGSGGNFKRVPRTKKAIEDLTRNLQGSMTNYLGGVYEIAIASTLKTSFEDIFSTIEMTGANTRGPGATTVQLSTTPLGRSLMTGVSKTDIHTTLRRISDQVNVEMNLSVKNQKFNPGKNSETKAFETGLNYLVNAVITQESHDSTLRTGFMNPSMYKASSSMNTFLGSLMMDIAIAGLPGDRIDFMVYQNAVIPLADYYRIVNRVSILPTGGGATTAAKSVLNTGNTPIAFRVRTKGL